MEAMRSDLFDTQGGTTIEGIHTGVMAGTLEVIKQDFAGLDLSGDVVSIKPDFPAHWESIGFSFCHRKIWYEVHSTQSELRVSAKLKGDQKVDVMLLGKKFELEPKIEAVISLNGH